MAQLKIAGDFKLPLEAVTQTFGVLAKRGVGKTYTAKVMCEEMLAANAHCVVVDPIGVWWGLRVTANNKAGLPIVVMGGEHGDVPLDPKSGELVSKLIIDERVSCVLDLSLMRKGESAAFMQDFAETLYRKNRAALHLFVDEADAFAPQRPMPGEQRMLGAMEDIVRRGRARGLGCSLITQRAAVLNKNVLTQIEVLITLRTVSPQDRAAIDDWVKVHGTPEQRDELMRSLASLPIGDAWFWSPGWLNVFQRITIRKLHTFDSSATPNVGKAARRVEMAPIDLETIRAKLATTIQKAKADDPKELRRQIAELQKAESKRQPDDVSATAVVEADKRGYQRGWKEGREDLVAFMSSYRLGLVEANDKIRGAIDYMDLTLKAVRKDTNVNPTTPARQMAQQTKPTKSASDTTPGAPGPASSKIASKGSVGRGEMQVLTAAASTGGVGKRQLTVLLGFRRSTRNTYIQRLSQAGLVVVNGDRVVATREGLDALGDFEPLPMGAALRDYWMGKLPTGERVILDLLVNVYPGWMERSLLDEPSGFSRSTRNTYIQRLSARELIEIDGQSVRASEMLFD